MNLRNTFINGIRNFISDNLPRTSKFGEFHKSSVLVPPVTISGRQNIYIANNCSIASDAILYATNARIIIKQYFVSAKGLHIITGAHERRIGRFCASITEDEKDKGLGLDQDVVIHEDVWAGMDVTILPGVTIGRGCTLAACAVVTKSTPPYSIWGGQPARFIKFYWDIDQIIEHERQLYNEEERYTREQLENIFKQYPKE